MRISESRIRRIIKEELARVGRLAESSRPPAAAVAQSVIEWINDPDEVDYKLSELESELPGAEGPDGFVDPGALGRHARGLLMTIAGELGCGDDECPMDEVMAIVDEMRSAMS